MQADGANASSVSKLIDERPWSRFQIRTSILLVFAVLFEGIDLSILSLSIPSMARSWSLTPSAFASVTGFGFAASMIGAIVIGTASDRLGRRWPLIGSAALCGAATFAAVLAKGLPSFTVLRVVAGIGIGGIHACAMLSVAEHTPVTRRALIITLTALGVPLGGVIAGAVGTFILVPYGWQSLFLLGGCLPLLLVFVYLVLLPESPVFLALRDDGGKSLDDYFRRAGGPIAAAAVASAPRLPTRVRRNIFREMDPELRRNTLLIWVAFFTVVGTGYMVPSWLPALLTQAGATVPIASATYGYVVTGSLLGPLAAPLLVLWFGSRPVMFVANIIVVAASLFLVMRFDSTGTAFFTVLVLGVLMVANGMLVSLAYTLLPTIYPEHVRGSGTGIAISVGRLGAVASAFLAGSLLYGGGRAFFGITTVAAVLALASIAYISKHAPSGR